MAKKLTKTQKRNLVSDIHDKAFKLLRHGVFSVKDFTAIKNIADRVQKRID